MTDKNSNTNQNGHSAVRPIAEPNAMCIGLRDWYIPGFPTDQNWPLFVCEPYITEFEVRVLDFEMRAFDEVTIEFMNEFRHKYPDLYQQHICDFELILAVLGEANARMKKVMAGRTTDYRLPGFEDINWSGDSMVMCDAT